MLFFAVSDIHGCFDALIEALSEKGFDSNNEHHKLIVCGDLFDRGTQHVKLYYYVKELVEKNRAIVVKGNHELFFMDLIHGERRYHRPISFNIEHNGFGKTLSDLTGIDEINLDNYLITELRDIINERHPEFLDWVHTLPFFYETDHYVFTHAGIDLESDDWRTGNFEKQVWQDLRTYQHVDLKSFDFYKKIVMGHYPTHHFDRDNKIYRHKDEQKIFIDGGCVYFDDATINVLVVED